MFESAILRRPFSGKNVSVGSFAEALLFYQNIHLILDSTSLGPIDETIGIDNFLRLITDGYIKASFMNLSVVVLSTAPTNFPSAYGIGLISNLGDKKKNLVSREEFFELSLERRNYDKKTARRYARRLAEIIPDENLNLKGKNEINLQAASLEDILDKNYANHAAREVVRNIVPNFSIPSHWRFEVVQTNDGLVPTSNYEFATISTAYRSLGGDDNINPASVMSRIADAQADLTFSAKHMAELVTSSITSSLLQYKFSRFIAKREKNAGQIAEFQQLHFQSKSLTDVLESKERSFSEFIDLLDRSRKFKGWLKDAHPEEGLIKEYVKALTTNDWIDGLPGKITRMVLVSFAGIGVEALVSGGTGIALAAGLTAADAIYLDRFLKGWRPSQFIEDEMIPFVQTF